MKTDPGVAPHNGLAADLDNILADTGDLLEELRDRRIFITGGTGFFGCWLLESIAWANARLGLNISAVVLTRDREAFAAKAPHLAANPCFRFHAGDIRDYGFPDGEFSHIVHAAATSARATFNNEDPLAKFDTVVEGTRHTLEFAVKCNAEKFLFTSSGAVYGKQPPGMTHIPEDYVGAPRVDDPAAAWGEAKRAAEFLCSYYASRFGLETKIARCFSFAGPYLPLDIHYAIGNFIRDGLAGGPIRINGDGTPYRSYLYASDLITWLWTILLKGRPSTAYNVGSEEDLTISEIAHTVAGCFEYPVEVRTAGHAVPATPANRYVPSTDFARTTLGVHQTFGIREAIKRTIDWHRALGSHDQVLPASSGSRALSVNRCSLQANLESEAL